MQKWEYKTILRTRGWHKVDKKKAFWEAMDWDIINMGDTLTQLGEEGWELVAVSSKSGVLGGPAMGGTYGGGPDYAGFTTEELWVFKRLKM